MQKKYLALPLALICLSAIMTLSSAQDEWWKECKAKELTTQNWHDYVGKDKYVFLDFYTTYCIWCKRLVPEYNKLWEMFHGKRAKRSDVLIAKINGGDHREIAYAYGVTIFPSLILIEKGTSQMKAFYNQERTAEAMYNWIESVLPPEKKPTPKPAAKETPKAATKQEPRKTTTQPKQEAPRQETRYTPQPESTYNNRVIEEELRQQIKQLKFEIADLVKTKAQHEETITSHKATIEDLQTNLQTVSDTLEEKNKEHHPEGFGFGTLASSFVLGGVMGAGVGIVYKTLNHIHVKN